MAATYWRLSITAIGGLVSSAWYPALSHLRFFDGVHWLETTGGTASASSEFSGTYVAANAFDSSLSNDWASVDNDLPAWIQYQFPTAHEVTAIRITSGTATIISPTLRAPKNFTLQSSNNGTDWTDVLSYADIAWTAASQELYFGPVSARATVNFLRRDMEDGGPLRIIEPVTRLNSETAQRRRVRLCDQRSGRVVREQWHDLDSDTVDFQSIREGPYVLYSLDHTYEHEAVAISDRLATVDGLRP